MGKHLSKHLPLRPHYYGCPKCRTCCYTAESADYRPLCPTYHHYRSVVQSGAGINKLAANLFEGNLPLSEEVASAVYKCTLCKACDDRCPMSCWPTRTNLLLRRELVTEGLGPPEPLRQQRESILREHNPFGKPHRERFRFPSGSASAEDVEYVVYAGCHLSHEQTGTALAAARVLDRLGIAYRFFEEERCCGFPLYQMGYEKEAAKLANEQQARLAKTGCTILFLCSSCFHNFKVVRKSSLPVRYFSEVVAEALNGATLRATKEETITYHDPCALGRGSGVYDAPRRILDKVEGVSLAEMPRARESAWCCGAGGGADAHQPEATAWSASERTDEAAATGASTLVTSCPKCKDNLGRSAGSRVRVVDLAEFLDEALE